MKLNNYQFKLKPTFEAKLIRKMRLERCPQSNFGH